MRVIILTADYPPRIWSGIGTAVHHQACGLAAIGVELDVLVGGSSGCRWRSGRGRSPRVHPLDRQRFPVDWRGADAVHLHSLALAGLALELRRRSDRPLVYTAHSLLWRELGSRRTARFWCAVQEHVVRVSDHVVFLSAAELRAASMRWRHVADRASVIPDGVPRPPRRKSSASIHGPVVFAGRFTRSKGIELVGELVPQIRSERIGRVVLAGGHCDRVGQRVMQRIQRTPADSAQVLGWLQRPAMDALFASAGLVIVPSLYEPFGLVALEAMRLGTPVLAAAVGGLAEIVGPDSGGRLVASHDQDAWIRAIQELFGDASKHQELRARGPGYVAARFDRCHIAQRLRDEVYAA
jgi:glycosyltransferase involved in cell wall biosynthesis